MRCSRRATSAWKAWDSVFAVASVKDKLARCVGGNSALISRDYREVSSPSARIGVTERTKKRADRRAALCRPRNRSPSGGSLTDRHSRGAGGLTKSRNRRSYSRGDGQKMPFDRGVCSAGKRRNCDIFNERITGKSHEIRGIGAAAKRQGKGWDASSCGLLRRPVGFTIRSCDLHAVGLRIWLDGLAGGITLEAG